MNNKIVFGIGGIVTGLVLAFVFISSSSGFRNYGIGMMGNNRIATSNTQITSAIDSHFIEQMIPHHEGAISMSNLALKKAKHQEIKTLATAIIAGQTKEINDMRSWYVNWFGKDVPKISTYSTGGMMSGGGMHMGGQEDMTALENASDFDKAFIEEMIPHHQLAIMMARMLRAGTNRPEMQQLADNIITSQSQEIQEMQTWYKQWYQ